MPLQTQGKQKKESFLPSGLYRRYRDLTGSAFRFADLRLSPITAGGESHPALKQIYIGYYRGLQPLMSRIESESMGSKKAVKEDVSKIRIFIYFRYIYSDFKHKTIEECHSFKRRDDIINDFLSTYRSNKGCFPWLRLTTLKKCI